MGRKHFGTDGIRGRANSQLTAELALKVGQAAGLVFQRGEHRHRVVIGKDTRLSSYMIEYALVGGCASRSVSSSPTSSSRRSKACWTRIWRRNCRVRPIAAGHATSTTSSPATP